MQWPALVSRTHYAECKAVAGVQQQPRFEIQQKRFKDSSLVTVHRKGWSDKVQTFRITVPAGESELAGLFAPAGKWKTAPQLNGTVETIPLADFVTEQGIFDPVSYVLIDVEGKEPNVIRGMKLERNRHIFPLFQYELGGTWTDSRHDADQWGQYGIAVYLRALGYNLYLAGADGGEGSKKPVLLSLHPEFFRFTCLRPEIDVGGNLLAVHTSFIDSGFQVRDGDPLDSLGVNLLKDYCKEDLTLLLLEVVGTEDYGSTSKSSWWSQSRSSFDLRG